MLHLIDFYYNNAFSEIKARIFCLSSYLFSIQQISRTLSQYLFNIIIIMKPIASKFSRPTTAKKPQFKQQKEKSSPSPSPKVLNPDDDNILELMEQLVINQKQCERTGKYVEAESFKRKVKALQEQIEKRDMIQIRQSHEEVRKQMYDVHLQQLNCFNIQWNEKMSQLQKSVVAMQQQLINKHEQQLRLAEQQLNADKPNKFKESAHLLNLKKIEQELAKQENYIEAHQIQVKAQKLEKQQVEKWKNSQVNKSKINLQQLRQKQENEINALRQRIQMMIQQRKLQREQQEQAMILKYQNASKQLENQQKQQILKMQKAIKLKNVQKKTKIGVMSASKVSLA